MTKTNNKTKRHPQKETATTLSPIDLVGKCLFNKSEKEDRKSYCLENQDCEICGYCRGHCLDHNQIQASVKIPFRASLTEK